MLILKLKIEGHFKLAHLEYILGILLRSDPLNIPLP